MSEHIRSAVIAGAIAFVVYTGISIATGQAAGTAAAIGLLFFIGTALMTFVIANVISARKR